MATGLKANNVIQGDGVSWEDHYGIDADLLTNATRANFLVERKINPNGGPDFADCKYLGSGALTTSQFANFPAGSTIQAFGLATPALYFKTGAVGVDTWKYQAVNT